MSSLRLKNIFMLYNLGSASINVSSITDFKKFSERCSEISYPDVCHEFEIFMPHWIGKFQISIYISKRYRNTGISIAKKFKSTIYIRYAFILEKESSISNQNGGRWLRGRTHDPRTKNSYKVEREGTHTPNCKHFLYVAANYLKLRPVLEEDGITQNKTVLLLLFVWDIASRTTILFPLCSVLCISFSCWHFLFISVLFCQAIMNVHVCPYSLIKLWKFQWQVTT